MDGDPRRFETFFSRLGFRLEEESPERLSFVWRGGRFPGSLCLGTAFLLMLISVPVLTALHSQGWKGAAASLWYFPAMNLFLFAIAFYLLSLKRQILVDRSNGRVLISKRSLWRHHAICVSFQEIRELQIVTDLVYSGAAVAGSTAGQKFFPVPSLRLVLVDGSTLLLDRGSQRRMEELARLVNKMIDKRTIEN